MPASTPASPPGVPGLAPAPLAPGPARSIRRSPVLTAPLACRVDLAAVVAGAKVQGAGAMDACGRSLCAGGCMGAGYMESIWERRRGRREGELAEPAGEKFHECGLSPSMLELGRKWRREWGREWGRDWEREWGREADWEADGDEYEGGELGGDDE